MNSYYAGLIAEMENEAMRLLADRILVVLADHRGIANAITREDLEICLRPYYREVKDLGRKIRLAVQEMRNRGVLVLSCAGSAEGRGYYLPASKAEVMQFIEAELRSKIVSMSITLTAVEKAADRMFGPAYQENLI